MWVILASITKRIKGTNTEFLKMITGKRAKQLGDGTWETTGSEGIREAAGTQLDRIYIDIYTTLFRSLLPMGKGVPIGNRDRKSVV